MAILGGSTISYHIGNSLTQDSRVTDTSTGMMGYARDMGKFLFPCYHIYLSQGLNAIFNSPDSSSFLQGGQWNQALPARQRDYLTLQPFHSPSGLSTLGNDTSACIGLINAFSVINPTGKIFIYGVWQEYITSGVYQSDWLQAVTDDDSQDTKNTRNYYTRLYDRLNALYPGRIFYIPAGEVFYQVDIAAKAGQIAGLSTAFNLHRDSLHGGEAGRFIATATVLACFFKTAPTASQTTIDYYIALGGGATLTYAMAAQLETIVWATVRADARTGVPA